MYKKLAKKMLLAGVSFSMLAPVFAEDQYYAGGGLAFLEYSEDGVSDDASLNAIFFRLGMSFNENFSSEIRAGLGMGDDSVGVDADVELDNFFGAYVRGGIPVAESFFPYAIVGYTRGEATLSASGFGSESASESDVSYGVGADFGVVERLILNIEYMNYLDKDGAEIDGFSLSAVITF